MEGLVGKAVVIFYDDSQSVSRKDGILTQITDTDYILDDKLIIPKHRVIRVEVQK